MTRGTGERARTWFVLVLFLLSGAAGLVYQVVWMRKLILILGVTSQAVSTVLGVFMGGLALGAWWLGRRGDRTRAPLALYGWLELGIAVLGVASVFLLDGLVDVYAELRRAWEPSFGGLTLMRVGLASLVLLAPTTLMGATLPILVRGVCASMERVGRQVGLLYALNTLGAALGTLAAGFFLIEAVGLRGTIFVAAGLNVVAGLGALLLDRAGADVEQEEVRAVDSSAPRSGLERVVLVVFGASGFLALAYEVLWTRYLIYVVGENSTYAFSSMLIAFLLGLVLGSLLASFLADRVRDPVGLLGAVVALVGVGALGTLLVMGPLLNERRVGGDGETWLASTVAAFLRCLAVLIVPTTLSGATFPLVARLYATRVESLGSDVGRAYAVNTLGAIAGALAGGFLVLPLLGLRAGLALLGAVNVAVGLVLLLQPREEGRSTRTAGAVAGLGLLALTSALVGGDPQREVLERNGREILFYEDGAESSVAVVRAPATRDVQIYVDGDGQASTELRTQIHLRLLGHLPALLHPDPRDGLVVGFGGGVTTGCLAQHPLERLDVVELNPAVREWAVHWEEFNHDPLHDSKVRLIRDDGRNFLLYTDDQYDVITSDPIDPDDAGVTSLYSREYYELVHSRLREGGVAAQWMTAHYDPEVYRTLVRTFQSVFPNTTVWFAYYTTVLVGQKDGPGVRLEDLRERFEVAAVRDSLAVIGVDTPESTLSFLFAGPEEVRELVGEGPINTDDRPYVEYVAPRWRGGGEATGGIADAFFELGRPDWQDALASWDEADAARIERGFGWVHTLLERDFVDREERASTGEAREGLLRRHLDLTWELFAAPVPPMVLLMAGLNREDPPAETPAAMREGYVSRLEAGFAAWERDEYPAALEQFLEASLHAPGALRAPILVAACQHRGGDPVAALSTLLRAGFGPEDITGASGWLPHKVVPEVFRFMEANERFAANIGSLLHDWMPLEENRPASVGRGGAAARPGPSNAGDASAWRRWWLTIEADVAVQNGRFVWLDRR